MLRTPNVSIFYNLAKLFYSVRISAIGQELTSRMKGD